MPTQMHSNSSQLQGFTAAQQTWLLANIPELSTHNYPLQPLVEHADHRRYYRLQLQDRQIIIMQTRPPFALQNFIQCTEYLQSQASKVASILAHDLKLNICLLQDLGQHSLHTLIRSHPNQQLYYYQQAILTLIHFQQHSLSHEFSTYCHRSAMNNIDLCQTWFIEKLCAIPLTPVEQRCWKAETTQLLEKWDGYSTSLCHRDYHSDNLMYHQTDKTIYIIDHQDICRGPSLYDLASLLYDHYITIPDPVHTKLVDFYRQNTGTNDSRLQITLAELSLQRHLKNMGIFSRLALRDHKPHYLNHLPRMIQCMQTLVSTQLPQYQGLFQLILKRYLQIHQRLYQQQQTSLALAHATLSREII